MVVYHCASTDRCHYVRTLALTSMAPKKWITGSLKSILVSKFGYIVVGFSSEPRCTDSSLVHSNSPRQFLALARTKSPVWSLFPSQAALGASCCSTRQACMQEEKLVGKLYSSQIHYARVYSTPPSRACFCTPFAFYRVADTTACAL